MPVSAITRNMQQPEEPLRIPQARVLQALMPQYPDDPPSEWPLITRAQLAYRAGYTVKSGTVTRALNGIRDSKDPRSRSAIRTSGDPHPGVLTKGLVEVVMVDIHNDGSGVKEVNYRITHKGIKVFQKFLASGGKIPKVKDADLCVNDRYLSGQ